MHMRSQRRRRQREQAVPVSVSPAQEPHAQVLDDETARLVREALAELPAAQAEVIALHHLVEQPQADIAEHMGCSVGTVKSRLHRGLGSLRTILRRRGVAVSSSGLVAMLAALPAPAAAVSPLPAAAAWRALNAEELALHTVSEAATTSTLIGVPTAVLGGALVAAVGIGAALIGGGAEQPTVVSDSAAPAPIAAQKLVPPTETSILNSWPSMGVKVPGHLSFDDVDHQAGQLLVQHIFQRAGVVFFAEIAE